MSVRILLDNPPSFYTNLDFISGRVVLNLNNDENVTAVVVKLEGESRTLLMRPMAARQSGPNQRQGGVATENHKILYRVEQVFPKLDPKMGAAGSAYTLRPGQYEYPFRLKIPFNNSCSAPHAQQIGPGGGFAGFGLAGLQQLQYKHVKRTLPPSLTGFPDEAEIRYYVKVTVQRPSLFKENWRAAVGFKFLPIEPPRPPPSTSEVFARRPYVFQAGLASYSKKSSMFRKNPTPLSDTAPKGEVDARLPSPAILTCNEPLPLRVIVRKKAESPENVFLLSLQIHLFGTTEVRAMDVVRTERSSWVLLSLNELSMPIGSPSDKVGTETILDKVLWDRIPLPNTVSPSFHTCNLTRRYEIQIRVGLGFGVIGEIQPQTILLPLNFQVEIYSGINPPAALLNAMASQHTPSPIPPVRPTTHTPTPAYDPAYPPQLGTPGAPAIDDAPPSYEDAMAEDITPADGPRPEYSGVTDENGPSMDEKGPAPSYRARPGDQMGNPQGSGPSGGRGTGAGGNSAVV